MKKLIAFAGALLVALACSEGQQTPTDVQFAKGGKKADFEITDYWVTTGENWQNVIHIGGLGSSVEAVGAWPVHDYWHNGLRDDDVLIDGEYYLSDHYEVTGGFWGSPVPVTRDGNKWWVEIPWNGERDDDGTKFRDFIVSDGPDPFVFSIRYRTTKGETRCGYGSPLVMLDGEVLGMQEEVGGQTVYSYAQFKGNPPDGPVVVSALSLSDVTCTHSRRKGAKASTTIEGVAHAELTGESWVEFHLIVDGDWTERQTATGTIIDRELTTELPGHVPGPVEVGLVLDYVVPQHEFVDWAYDPANNTVDTLTIAQLVDCN